MATYMHIPNIKGNVSAKGYQQWIEVYALSQTVSRNVIPITKGSSVHRSAGPVIFSEFELTKPLDCASPLLFHHLCTGQVISQVSIAMVHTGATLSTYQQYTLKDVMISTLSRYNDGEFRNPYEVVHLNFTQLEEKFTPYNENMQAESPIASGYNLQTATVL